VPDKELLVVAGPNGAGKTTFIDSFLAEHPCRYLSADLIASEFSKLNPDLRQVAAGRSFLNRFDEQLAKDENFVIETTLSGRTLQTYLDRAKAARFSVTIWFIYLDSADSCLARINQRVLQGGHNVPESDVRRRFSRSLSNFWYIYREIADNWYVVYNSSGELKWIASGEPEAVWVHETSEFQQFLRLAGADDDEIYD
jgi:predicted ABC-type ATPase